MSQTTEGPGMPPIPGAVPPLDPPIHPVTPPMVLALKATRPWVLFLSILGFVIAGLAVAGGLILVVAMAAAGSIAGSIGNDLTAGMGAAMGILLGGLYLLLGVLYFFPSLYLFRYAGGIARMLGRDPVGGMEAALWAQKAFWKFVGIAMIAAILLYVLIILAVVLVAVLAAARAVPGA